MAGVRGSHLSEEHKRKISLANIGRLKSKEHCENISKAKQAWFAKNPGCGSMQGKTHSTETKQKIGKSSRERFHSWESNEKRSNSLRGRPQSEEWKEKRRNRQMTAETCKKISLARLGVPRSAETRERISTSRIKRILEKGNYTPYSLRGRFYSNKNQQEIRYDSSYELAAFKILEQLLPVKCYSRCTFSVDYIFEEAKRKYLPDILVTYQDMQQEVIEIKPFDRLFDPKINTKHEAAEALCKEKGMKFSVWCEGDLGI